MKNNRKFIGLLLLSACLLCSSPDVVAQASPSDNTSATTRDYNDGDDDNGKWGLAGLIGLVGLLGLRGRDNDNRRTTTTVNR